MIRQPLILDGHKLPWHMDRVNAWLRGERIAPVTIDASCTRACNYHCQYCFAQLQENDRHLITQDVVSRFLDDCAEIGVKGISLVSDGESTVSSAFPFTVRKAKDVGLDIALGTNGYLLTPERSAGILECLTYLRVNFSAGTPQRYAEVMGVTPEHYERVCENVAQMVRRKAREGLGCTIGLQMVLTPADADQIIPFAQLAVELGVDYGIVKHCSDDEEGSLGLDYDRYAGMTDTLRAAEALSTAQTQIIVKWSKIGEPHRTYRRCYGPPFMLQLSGSGLVAPCGFLFNTRYAKFHIGNICETPFKQLWQSDRYWRVMEYIASAQYDARRMCGSLCLQHAVNRALNAHLQGKRIQEAANDAERPAHVNFL